MTHSAPVGQVNLNPSLCAPASTCIFDSPTGSRQAGQDVRKTTSASRISKRCIKALQTLSILNTSKIFREMSVFNGIRSSSAQSAFSSLDGTK